MMRAIFLILLSVLFLQPDSAQAFNSSRCKRLYKKVDGFGKNENLFVHSFTSTTSTAQYFTSTGKCRLIGGISKDERKLFLADNFEQLKMDIVQAQGEYLTTVSNLYNCESRFNEQFGLRVQENVSKIFGEKFEYNPSKFSEELDSFMINDPHIQKMCGFSNV